MLRALVGKGSSHRLTLQGTGGDAGRREMARVCAGCQGGHLSPPSPGRTQPGALDGQVWRPWRGPGREHGGQWGTTSRSCGQCGLGPGHQVAWVSKSQCCSQSSGRGVSVAGAARAQLSPAARQGLQSHVAGTGVPLTPPPPTDLDPAGLGLGAGGTVLPTPVLSSGQRAGQSRCFPHGRASCLPDLLLTSRGHPTSAQPRQPHLALTLPFRDRHGGGWSVLGLAR